MWVIFFVIGKDYMPILALTVFFIIAFIAASLRNSTYFIYEDRIELFNSFTNKLSTVIKFDQIDQVRYEDGFTDSYGYFWSDFIIIYPKKDVVLKNLRKNRIMLTVTGFNRKSKILKLLKFFQSKNFEVKLKTDSKKILEETGVKNWDQA